MPEATITASIPVARANATIRLPFCFEDIVSPTALPYDSAEVPYKGHTPHRPKGIQRGWAAPRAAGPMGVGRPGRPMRAGVGHESDRWSAPVVPLTRGRVDPP